jgi:integrase
MTQNDLQDFYIRLKANGRIRYADTLGNTVSDRMVRACHANCRASLEKAVKEGLITLNPAIGCKLPPKKSREMQVLTHEEIQRFLIQAKNDDVYELYLLALTTGMRRGEIVGLQWNDLNVNTGELKIQRQVFRVKGKITSSTPKTKSSIRTVKLPKAVVNILLNYKDSTKGSQWMFPSPVKEEDMPRDPVSIYKKMQRVLERADCKKIRFHDLRHTFATMALENGMDVKTLSAMIGHVSSATTIDIYSHVTPEMKSKAACNIDKGFGKADTSVNESEVPTPEKRKYKKFEFKPQNGKIRKSGSGGIYQINENLWEGSFTPTHADGKRKKHTVYAKTREECEERLEKMIKEVREQIAEEKSQMNGLSM